MSKRAWDGNGAPWIVLIAGLAVIALFAWTIPYSKGYQDADKRHQADYDQAAADYEAREKCRRLNNIKAAVDCYENAARTSRENQRSEQDLDAQREMANWAEGVLWATIAAFAAALAGVGFLWNDTRHTREIGQAQSRAYLSIDVLPPNVVGEYEPPEFEFIIKNSGQSPARNLRHIAFAGPNPYPMAEGQTDLVAPRPEAGKAAVTIAAGEKITGSVDTEINWQEAQWLINRLDQERAYYIAGVVWYDDVFGFEHKRRFCFIPVFFETDQIDDNGKKMLAINFVTAPAHNDET